MMDPDGSTSACDCMDQSSGSGMDCGSSDGRTGVSDMGTGFLCAESSGGRDPDSGYRR